MKKDIKLSQEARLILIKLSHEQLHFLKGIKEDKNFTAFEDIVNFLIDFEKNSFFGENEASYDNPVWQSRHAYARGGVAKLIMLIHIIKGAEYELEKREVERKKKKDE